MEVLRCRGETEDATRMASQAVSRGADGSDPGDVDRIAGDPLGYLHAEHLSRRRMLQRLERMASSGRLRVRTAVALRRCLATGAFPCEQDLAEDLLPLLRRRAPPCEDVDRLVCRLRREHGATERERAEVLIRLASPGAAHDVVDEGGRNALRALARGRRRALLLGDAVVLPLARHHLRPGDLRTLALRMALRRGICLLRPPPADTGQGPGLGVSG